MSGRWLYPPVLGTGYRWFKSNHLDLENTHWCNGSIVDFESIGSRSNRG